MTDPELLAKMVELTAILDEAEVPTEGRKMYVHPWMAEAAVAAGILVPTDDPQVFDVNPDAFR